jgi:FtsP/CotA-like multicopper oxidase with cupredoxin domain
MNKRLVALAAAFVLLVSSATPGIARMSPPVSDAAPAPAAVVAPGPDAAPAAPALPASAVDESKVPHYFGPYPNWANSPFTLPDVAVTIDGDGFGATATATVGANGAVTGITLVDPGSGYTTATVSFTGAGTGAAASATVAASGAVTSVTVDQAGSGYTAPTVSFTGGGGTGTLVQVGNQLIARTFATDYATAPGTLGPVLVVNPTPMPANGKVQSIQYFNQATAGSSPTPSEGNLFHAYVLKATGVANEYTVAWDSGLQTVPVAIDPVGDVVTIAVPDVAVTTDDRIAFYGEGIPLDDAGGSDILSYPAVTPPSGTITLGGPEFPIFNQVRTYSFAASVLDASGVTPLTPAAATAYGGVDAIDLGDPGSGYSFPTVDIDFPDGVDGVQATAHAVCVEVDCAPATDGGTVTINGIVVDNAGSGYSTAPNVVIRNGTIADPINPPAGFADATATATLAISSIVVDDPGDGYVSAPTVTINDPTGAGAGATATAAVNAGAVIGLTLTAPGSGYITPGIKKFEDALPGLCNPALPSTDAGSCPTTGKYIPLGVPEAKTYPPLPDPKAIAADEYVIGLIQYKTSFSSSLPDTMVRGYIQLETPANAAISQHWPVTNTLMDGTQVPVMQADGVTQWLAVTPPQWLGPTIVASKNKPVRIVFHNLLPTGKDGNLFLPVDTTLMGSGTGPVAMGDAAAFGTVMDEIRNPACSEPEKWDNMDCFLDNRATLHLHGGITPWISDGTPHQWITPDTETTLWPQGVSVGNVPDMNVCEAADDGCQTFYYTNQQSARLMFYHDHAWGITRLNVYAGEAAGYLITDEVEQKLFGPGGTFASMGEGIPLVVQDRTFVPGAVQLAQQDPTWDTARWGGMGNFWYHHVYMPAQNPGDPDGMSSYGRWMYGPWFWPPATPPNGPIANPYYNMDPLGPDLTRGTADDFTTPLAIACDLDNPATWQYDTDPFCEPKEIPGTPNISVGMEQFNDTPIVNGVAYPTVTLEPKTYRLRVLNAANDRFMNFQWYVGDPDTASTGLNKAGDTIGATEVALKQAEVDAAQLDPVVFPTPVLANNNAAGPDWVQIGTEGGFLPAPVVVDGQQPTTWITDPTRFDVGLVDQHSLLLAPAERADVIVDFSKFAGRTLILYNDAPAAFPARVPSYDYYTGAPDQFPNAAPGILPGYGPNTRTIMQVKIAATTPATAFDLPGTTNDGLGKLRTAFSHKANGSGVFEAGQPPIFVGQAAYNSAYGTSFVASSDCNAPGSTLTRCDGFVRINDGTQVGSTWSFNTLKAPNAKMSMKLEPKAIHDEMNSTAFDEFGRMTANLGIEAQPPTPGQQNVTLYPYINPATELIDATNLPRHDVIYDATTGLPTGDVKILPIASAADGSQIWRITHNGVDTHPIHFHLYDVQVLNRVAWDNNLKKVDATELGWKDTVRISPLEDTIVALRPIIPDLPWELPNAVRPLNPMMPLGFQNPPATPNIPFNNTNPQGIPTDPIVNELVNFGWEYVFHCHILSHEEMDMMRPVLVAMPPVKADGLVAVFLGTGENRRVELTWMDNSIAETAFRVERSSDGTTWTTVGTILSPLDQTNDRGLRNFTDAPIAQAAATYNYRIVAENKVGYLGANGAFPTMTVKSVSAPISVNVTVDPPVALVTPTSLDFGSVATGTPSASQTVTVGNTGASDLTVSGVTLGGTDAAQFSLVNNCTTVAPAGTCTINVVFTPATDGAKSATLDIAHDGPGPSTSVALTGTGLLAPPVATVAPTSLAFGSITTGTTSASQTVTVGNTGASDLIVSGAALVGANPGQYTIPTNTCTLPVAPGGSCTISVAFAPTSTGAKPATLSIAHNAVGTPSLVTLTGTGVAPAPLTTFSMPVTQNLGSKAVGTSTLKTVLVSNTGPNPLIVATATAGAPFSLVTLGTCANPVAVGKTCKLNVTFAPTSVGNFSVPLVVTANATNSPQQTILTGTGR